MDYFKQFRLLFSQRLLLRRRQPGIFCLELFWPAIVFLAVFLTRFNFPPNYKDTCTYHSKSLPSAGAVNFFQSFVCTLDNPCLNDTINEGITKFPQARIHQLVDHLRPLFDQNQTADKLPKLPKGIQLMDAIVQTLSDSTLRQFIEDGVQLKDILRDQTALSSLRAYAKESLSNEKLSNNPNSLNNEQVDQAINNLYYSSLNIMQLVHAFKNNNFKFTQEQYACEQEALHDLLVLKERNSLTNDDENVTVRFLCELSRQGKLDGLLQLTQKSIDLVKVLNWIRTLMRMLKLNEQHLHLNNVMLMLTTVEQRDMLSANHQWNISDHLQRRVNTLVHHIDHSKNGFVISLERLTQQHTLDSLIATISDIESELQHNHHDNQLAQALKVITTGLRSMEYFKNKGLFEVKYKFQELIRNVDSIRTIMETQLRLEPALIDIILGSSFDFTETVAKEQVDPFLLCNQESLKSIINFNDNDELLSDYNQKAVFDVTANSICVLSTAEGYLFTDRILRTFAIKKIVNNMLEIISNGVLENRNINRQEIPSALIGLKTATSSIDKVKPFLDKLKVILDSDDEDFDLNANGTAIDLIKSNKTGQIVGKIMCGTNDLPSLKSEFNNVKSIKNPKIDQNELNSLKSNFCRNGYLQIMQSDGGVLIWTWLKPILSGKVLYTPKNYATDQLIHEINSTMKSMESIISSLKAWTETTQSLRSFFDDKEIKGKIVDSKQFLPLVLGQGYENLFHDNETVQQLEKLANSTGIINLIELIGNVAQCIDMNRFIGYDTELQLEQAAKRYTKSHNLIAGIVFLNLNGNQYNYLNLNQQPSNRLRLPTLPKRIKYKLRVDIDFVPSTKQLKDRIWEPGAKDHFDRDLGYFKGFIQLQEMIDHAIIKVQLKNLEQAKQISGNVSTIETEFSLDDFRPLGDMHLTNLDLPSVYMQQMPYSCYKEDKFGFYILALSPVISTVAWIFLIAFSIRDFVLERELHLEEILYVTGLKPSVRWSIWFILAFCIMAFGCLCGLVIFRLADIIPNSDFTLVYLYFLAFCFSIVMYCYMISAFFKTATIASLSGIIVYLASYLPFMVAITLEHQLTLSNKLTSCLSMSTAFCFGIMYLARFETQGVGVQWSNIYQSPMGEDTMNFAYAFMAMLVDGLLYFLIGWYFSNVLATTNYGRKCFYFFLLPSYWGLCNGSSTESIEKAPSNQRGINIHNLCVTYNKGNKHKEHQAVSGLTMNLEEGQIATLLGKNGAGKTSTISVLTGILKPTSGQIYFYGHEFSKNFERIRQLLGYCPQYNVLFDRLTVREHLDFFARLKNLLPEKEIKEDVETMLNYCALNEVANELAMNLSGGLKRRLCVALAFIGGSKMIILDEPTASVDPMARRKIWDLIVSQKSTRTVLLTTHHMDEADILSDNVAIIYQGKLLCRGSPLLLKSKYGCGYQLTISRFGDTNSSTFKNDNKLSEENIKILVTDYDKENHNVTDSDSGRVSNNSIHLNHKRETSFNSCKMNFKDELNNCLINPNDKLMQFIKALIPNALKLDENLNEMIIALPRTGVDGVKHDYSTFFQCLDSNITRFGYHSYGLTSTTLEEVFLNLCSLQDKRFDFVGSLENKLNLAKKINLSMNSFYSNGDMNHETDFYNDQYNSIKQSEATNIISSGLELKIMQFKGLIKKRVYHTFTNWRTLFYNLIFPCVFIFFAMGMTTIKPHLAPDPVLPLNVKIYGSEATSFFASKYQFNHFDYQPNIGKAKDLLLRNLQPNEPRNRDDELDCPEPRRGWKVSKCPVVRKSFETEFPQYLYNFSNATLATDSECGQCFNYSGQVKMPILTSSGYVYDLSSISNLNHFLMKTFSLFNERRYGGWTLHQSNESANRQTMNEIWKVWFDNNGQHAIPSYLNTLNNALFRANLMKIGGLSEEQALDYSINSYSHPFHIRSAQLGDQNIMQKAGDSGIALIILVGFSFIPISFVFYIVKERKNEEKHMQRIFGVGTTLYWLVAIVYDMVIVLFSVLVAGCIIWSFQMPIYTTRLNFPAIMLLLLLFGWAMISVVYILEKLFEEASIAFMVIYCLALFVGINTMVFRLLIDVFKLLQVSTTFKLTFERIALIFPPYALMSGLVDITKNHLLSDMFQLVNQDVYVNPFSMELLLPHYIALAIEGVVLFIINLLIELVRNGDLWFLSKHFTSSTKLNSNDLLNALNTADQNRYSTTLYENGGKVNLAFEEDQDVFEERKRIITSELKLNTNNYYQDNTNHNDVLRVVNVSKKFKTSVSGRREKLVVDKVSFGVPPSECFGLLGTNGAGKTTLFKILTGQLTPSSGITMFNQQTVEKVLAGTCKILGYCPQADALDSTLSPRQHLAIYSLIRGIKHSQREKAIKDSLSRFQLNEFENFAVHSLSRGTKRKLCLAIAMLGNPQIVLLDEPTSGMDPLSRRCLYGTIKNVIKDRRSVLITSHSMEECDVLCSRIAIMVNGKFSCLGSPQYLKRKYGYGYTITLRLNENMVNYEKAIDFIKSHFPTILLRAHHHNMLEFSLPTTNYNDILLSKIFSYLDNAKTILNLQDYTISQTTLDQVFVNFASQENRDSLLRKQNELQRLPYLNDLKTRFTELQINETNLNEIRTNERYDEIINQDQRNNEELMQKKPSNLMKSTTAIYSHQFSQLPHLLPNQITNSNKHTVKRPLVNSNNRIHTTQLSTPINHLTINKPLNSSTSLYFNSQPSTQIANYKNYNQSISYPPGNYLNASNIYSLGQATNGHLYNTNTVQQPLIILPKTKRKK